MRYVFNAKIKNLHMLFILFLLSGHFRLRNGMKWLYWVMEIFPPRKSF
ncbi:hypothetical protein SJDPG12_03240 [Porphyromonas gingivalis SJD12]|nr:hypothetical protein SJDPG12_03240 [Porphyromonas gingivalis SJD12]